MQTSPYGKIDALAQTGKLSIPLVVLKNTAQNSNSYIGFIPGFLMKNISANTSEQCIKNLKEYLTTKLKTMIKQNEPFPFFPTEEEIRKDWDNVEIIEFVCVKSDKRKKPTQG